LPCRWRSLVPLPTGKSGRMALPALALALRWLFLFFCGMVYLGVRAWLTVDSGKSTLEGSELLRRAENPFAFELKVATIQRQAL
jgi:hypothetical protein